MKVAEPINLKSLAERIANVIVKAAGQKRNSPMQKRLARHDKLRSAVEKIYQNNLNALLEEACREVLKNLRSNYKAINARRRSTDSVVRANTTPVTSIINFDREAFAARFLRSMATTATEAFQVTSKGLLTELGQGEKATSAGVVREFVNNRINKIAGCPDNIYDQVNNSLEEGLNGGETMDELADRIKDEFDGISKGRAMVIAQTESQSVYGTAQADAIEQAGFKTKKWVTMEDELVRPTHVDCGEQGAIPVGEEFSNGLLYPGDPDGEAKEVINCRCYLIHGEDDGQEEDIDE